MFLLLTQMVFFDRDMFSFNLPEQAYLEQAEPISTLYPLSSTKYSCQNLTQFSQRNNVLDAPAYNTVDFFVETHVYPQLNWIGLFDKTEPISTFKHVDCSKYSFQNLKGFSQGKNVLDASTSH
jgi:hypothetical protein